MVAFVEQPCEVHVDVSACLLRARKLVSQCLTLVLTKSNRTSLYIYRKGLAGWQVGVWTFWRWIKLCDKR